MRDLLRIIGLGLLAILLQSTVLKVVLPDYMVPNLILSIVIYLAFYRVSPFGAVLAFVVGLQYDVFCSRAMLGPFSAASVVVFGMVASFSQRLFLESFLTVFVTAFISSFISHGVYLVVLSQFIESDSLLASAMTFSPIESFATALVTPFVFVFLKKVLPMEGGIRRTEQFG